LFRFKTLQWFLSRCGVIPINRVKDDPKAMRSVMDSFEACFRVLESGEAIGIFPEGVTYDDSRLREVKSGAARIALELEHRHQGKLGLKIVPVGLTYSAKELYRSDVLAHFGEPLVVAEFIQGYAERRKECIHELTAEIERRIQGLILHIPELEHTRVVEGVKRLYLERLILGSRITQEAVSPRAEALVLTQRISDAVEHVFRNQPQRAAAFVTKLNFYERWLVRLKISDETLVLFPNRERLVGQSMFWAVVALLGLPIALYGWVHRFLPHAIILWAVSRFSSPEKRKAQTSTTKILAGVIVYTGGFAVYVAAFHAILGLQASFWYALSLPPATLLAFYYLRELRRFDASLRTCVVLLRAPFAARRLLALRASLIAEIEAIHTELRREREALTI
ncbi:MAG: 1-acyl-sn-glycerol-3-phosphate acyltransferase, partial [Verrucomicrobiota bacterium]